MPNFNIGQKIRGKCILDKVYLSNGWYLVKTENKKSEKDFKAKVIYQFYPRMKSFTLKHAHFAIDLYGKLCANRQEAEIVFKAIIELWRGESVEGILNRYRDQTSNLPGYSLEYVLYALRWILE